MDMSRHASLAEAGKEASATESRSERGERGQAALILAMVALGVAGLAVSGYFFGIVGVTLPILATVPVLFVMLVLIARG